MGSGQKQIRNRDIMNDCTRKVLTELFSKKQYKRVLELGSGFNSTVFIRDQLSQQDCGGHLTSLENQKEWYNKTKHLNDDFGKVVYAPLRMNPIRYDYQLTGIYDLVLIDGPAFPHGKKFWNEMSVLVKGSPVKGYKKKGLQSAPMLGYVLPYVDKNTDILVDGRVRSVFFYQHRYHEKISVKSACGKVDDDYIKKFLKREWRYVAPCMDVGQCSLIKLK